MDRMALNLRKEEIRRRVDVEELLSRLGVDQVYYYRGDEIRCGCPIHKGDDPNFSFDLEKGLWTCFSHGCGDEYEGRDVFSLVQAVLDVDFRGALAFLADMTGVSLDDGLCYNKEKADLYKVQRWLKKQRRIMSTSKIEPISEEVLKEYRQHSHPYIAKRGFSEEIIERFEIGYAPDGEFKNRIIFPIRDDDGLLVGFSGRLVSDDQDVLKRYPKYKNMLNFKKGMVLYGLDKARDAIESMGCLILTEGLFDTMRAHEFGATNVASLMGTSLVPDQLRLILKYATEVCLCLDNDIENKAGQRATVKAINQLKNLCKVRVMLLPPGKDLDQLKSGEFWDIYDNAVTPLYYFRHVASS